MRWNLNGVTMFALAAAAILALTNPIAVQAPAIEAGEQIRIMPVSRTPESNSIILALVIPKQGGLVSSNPVWIQFRLDGYSLGSGSSQFDRAGEVSVSKLGQTVHVVVDERPYIAINEPAINPFNEEGWYYNSSYKFELPFTLDEGMHTIQMFPARSYGESLKGENTFQAISFYVGEKKNNPRLDLSKPHIIYNEPGDQIPLRADLPVLLDFYVQNCELTSDGYKVRLTVDGKINRILTTWQPYYIYGLGRGKHTIHLELIDASGNRVSGLYNDVERTILIR